MQCIHWLRKLHIGKGLGSILLTSIFDWQCLYGQNVLRGCALISLKDSIRSSPLATGFCLLLFEPLCIPYQLFILFCIFYLLFSPPISVLMGPMTVPSQSPETIKIPTAHYEFGANFIDHPKVGSHRYFYLSRNLSWKWRKKHWLL